MSGVMELVLVGQALGGLADYFLGRISEQTKKRSKNEKQYLGELTTQLERLGHSNKTVEVNLRASLDAIIELLNLREVTEDLKETNNLENLKKLFEKYSQNLLFLREVGIEYMTLVRNFNMKYDYRSEINLQLLDYYSDLSIMGILILEEGLRFVREEEMFLDLDTVGLCAAIADTTDSFVTLAETEAKQQSGKWTQEHSAYVLSIRHLFEPSYARALEQVGHASLSNGYCGHAARSYSRSKQVLERLSHAASDEESKKYWTNKIRQMEILMEKAVAFAWLERYRAQLTQLHKSVEPEKIMGKMGAFYRDHFGERKAETLDEIRGSAKDEMGLIDGLCKRAGIELQENPENLEMPDLDRFQKDVKLPEINWQPAPVA